MDNKIVKSLTTKKRQVNIELLRIIAMILVLLNHSTWNAKYFNIDMVHTDLLTSVGVLEVYGCIFVCVPCFVVISGYFGIHWKWKGLFNYLDCALQSVSWFWHELDCWYHRVHHLWCIERNV